MLHDLRAFLKPHDGDGLCYLRLRWGRSMFNLVIICMND